MFNLRFSSSAFQYLKSGYLIIGFALSAAIHAQDLQKKYKIETDGPLVSVAEGNDILYLGGRFERVGYLPSYGAFLDKNLGLADGDFPEPDGEVLTSIPDGEGGFYIGGSFNHFGDSVRRGLAHINSSGEVTNWAAKTSPNQKIHEIYKDEETVYIGGDFSAFGALSGTDLALVDPQTGQPNENFPKFNGYVYDLEADGNGGWYVAGSIYDDANKERNRIGIYHISSTGSLLDFNAKTKFSPGIYSGGVTDIEIVNEHLVAAGSFKYITDESSVSSNGGFYDVDGSFASQSLVVDGPIYSVCEDGQGGWIVGGEFTRINGESRLNIAQIDSEGNLTDWKPFVDNEVFGIDVGLGKVAIRGYFEEVNGNPTERLAVIDLESGESKDWSANLIGRVSSLVIDASKEQLYVSGEIDSVGGEPTGGIVALDLNDGSLVNNWSIVGLIHELVEDELIISRSDAIIKLDLNTGNHSTIDLNIGGSFRSVRQLGSSYLIGGQFTSVQGELRDNLALIDENGGVLDWSPNPNGMVRNIDVSGDSVLFFGSFTKFGQYKRAIAASVNANTLEVHEWNPKIAGGVSSFYPIQGDIAKAKGKIFVGIDIRANFNANIRDGLASFDLSTGELTEWSPLVEYKPSNTNTSPSIACLESYGNNLYIGGRFSRFDGQEKSNIVAVDMASGEIIEWVDHNPSLMVKSLAVTEDHVAFEANSGFGGSYIAVLNRQTGQSEKALDLAPDQDFFSLGLNLIEIHENYLFVGGDDKLKVFDLSSDELLFKITEEYTTDWAIEFLGDTMIVVGTSFFYVDTNKWEFLESNLHFNGDINVIKNSTQGLFIGGNLNNIGGDGPQYFAALDRVTGELLDLDLQLDAPVYAITTDQSHLLIGGAFSQVNDEKHNAVVSLDKVSKMVDGWVPEMNGVVRNLEKDGDWLYIHGDINSIEGEQKLGLACVDLETKELTDFTSEHEVRSFVIGDTAVYVSAAFKEQWTTRWIIEALDKSTGEILKWNSSYIDEGSTTYGYREKTPLIKDGEMLYVGGDFENISNEQRSSLAALDIKSGSVTNWNPSAMRRISESVLINTISVSDDHIFVGGNFDRVGGHQAKGFARVNLENGKFIESEIQVEGFVRVLNLIDDKLFIGGRLDSIDHQYYGSGLAVLDLEEQKMIKTYPKVTGDVFTIESNSTDLIIGGRFSEVDESSRNNLASIDFQSGALISWNPEVDGPINDIVIYEDQVVVCGSIHGYDIASFNLKDGNKIDWNIKADRNVSQLMLSGDLMFVSGSFESIASRPRFRFAAFDMTKGELTEWNGNSNSDLIDLKLKGDYIFTTGQNEDGSYFGVDVDQYSTGEKLAQNATGNTVGIMNMSDNHLLVNSHSHYTYEYEIYDISSFPINPVSLAILNTKSADIQKYKIFPNPAKEYFTVESAKKVIVYNQLGQLIKTHNFDKNIRCSISELRKGIYYIMEEKGDKIQFLGRLIVDK